MIWEVEIAGRFGKGGVERIREDFRLLSGGTEPLGLVDLATRGWLIEGDLDEKEIILLADTMLTDMVAQVRRVGPIAGDWLSITGDWMSIAVDRPTNLPRTTVLYKPGVMDPAAMSIVEHARELGYPVKAARSFRRYYGLPLNESDQRLLERRILANEAVEQIHEGRPHLTQLGGGKPGTFGRVEVPISALGDEALLAVSKSRRLALTLEEMRTIQSFYAGIAREPADIELETIAQTWSEHCSHKTLKGRIEFTSPEGTVTFQNMLKETIFAATQEVRKRLGAGDWCVSVFSDNAGVIRFDENYHLCFKVETHNRPSAIEPYGGANTGLGGVLRDILGTGLGAKPVCNTDVFCFGMPDAKPADLPPGVLHPRLVMRGVVSGVRDYGNRMGIPTVNGAVCFHPDYVANPLVFCGTVGLLPVGMVEKAAIPGDLVVSLGGRTGRDGIHGATFSSEGLTAESESLDGGAVQIGNAITEKKLMDALLKARDLGLYHAVTDCGAGGFSSAVGEMGEKLGAVIDLDQAPLKYEGLGPVEIWISESQERMVLAVPDSSWEQFKAIAAAEEVEIAAIGRFDDSGELVLRWHGEEVGRLPMAFLHDGRPPIVRQASWHPPQAKGGPGRPVAEEFSKTLLALLSTPEIATKEAIIRQYDHEVQGGSVVKPLVGPMHDGPSDAAVVAPILGSSKAFAVGCGIQFRLGRIDPYAMAKAAMDEAVRNLVAVGTDPARIAVLDNFCWGNTDRAEELGALVRAAQGCHDLSVAWMMPFISGKDSLRNEYNHDGTRVVIPPTLLISALGQVASKTQVVTMDLKAMGNKIFLVGKSRNALAGSHWQSLHGLDPLDTGSVPLVDDQAALATFHSLHQAIRDGFVKSCHDVSDGGVAVALAEMAIAGNIGLDIAGLATACPSLDDTAALFGESPSRFLVEVEPVRLGDFLATMVGVDCHEIGSTLREPRLRIAGQDRSWVIWCTVSDLRKAFHAAPVI